MKRKKTSWIETGYYSNGYIKTGIVWNNNPKHDVIGLKIYKTENKYYEQEEHFFTVDEALAVSYLLTKAVLFYLARSKENIRSWEYKKDEIPTNNQS